MKITLFGCGNAGAALFRSCLATDLCSRSELTIFQRSEERAALVSTEFGCAVYAGKSYSAHPECFDAEALIIAVKPQDFGHLAAEIAPLINRSRLVVSIMAGVTLAHLTGALGGVQQVVRAMPNLPIQIRRGITPYLGTSELTEENRSLAKKILNSCGDSLLVNQEWKIDAATAVSGSGPGYLYYFAEAFLNAAKNIGFTQEEASLLVKTTLSGSSELWKNIETPIEVLKEQVRSKGGTTHAAFQVFDSHEFSTMMEKAVRAAFIRCQELGNKSSC